MFRHHVPTVAQNGQTKLGTQRAAIIDSPPCSKREGRARGAQWIAMCNLDTRYR